MFFFKETPLATLLDENRKEIRTETQSQRVENKAFLFN